MKIQTLLTFILLLKNFIKNSEIISTSSEKFLEIKSTYSNLLQQHKSNSCIFSIFLSLEKKCSFITDEILINLSYKLTLCYLQKFGKKFECKNNVNSCVSLLKGDLWTTYINFYNNINNICYYYKILEYEKNNDLIVNKIFNYSNKIFENLLITNEISKEIIFLNNNLSKEIKKGLDDNFNKINNINNAIKNFQNYEKILNKTFQEYENKILNNKKEIEFVYNFFSNIFFHFNLSKINLFKFYSILFFFILCVNFIFNNNNNLTNKIFLLLILILIEISFVYKLKEKIYFNIILIIFRLFCIFIVFLTCFFVKNNNNNYYFNKQEKKIYMTYTDVKNYMNNTPIWAKNLYYNINKYKYNNNKINESSFDINFNEFNKNNNSNNNKYNKYKY